MTFKTILTLLLVLATTCAAAAAQPKHPNVVVEAVQMPAWVERANGARVPLAIDVALSDKDRIYTGPGARALLRLADGSLIKLGENAILGLDELGRSKIDLKEVLMATLDVAAGAFRFTTQVLRKFHGERDVKVKFVTITVGIRGTDVWGKAEKARDTVCLIEGAVAVTHGQQQFTMDQPMSFYIAAKNEPQLPVTPVSKEQLEKWAAEVEMTAGSGAIHKGGKWKVNLAEAANQGEALEIYDQLRRAGYAVQIRPVTGKGDTGITYRVRIANLPSKQEAEALAGKLKGKMGVKEPKVSK